MSAWDELGIEPTQDIRAIKRAYSIRLKTTRPDDDAQAYQQLREAYDWAQDYAKFHATYSISFVDQASSSAETDSTESPQQTLEAEAASEEASAPVAQIAIQEPPPPLPTALDEAAAQPVTVESLLQDCAKVWAGEGRVGLVQDWPRMQALLEDLPIAQHSHASRAFAQFVAEESELPVEVLIALTRHFQWGLDFRVDQVLGTQLAQAVYQRLTAAEVFAAFRPERYTQYAWGLALAKLWDDKRSLLARLLATGLDSQTRQEILLARSTTLHALGASRDSAKAAQNLVTMGGVMQLLLFGLLVVSLLVLLYEPWLIKKTFANVAVLGLVALALYFPVHDALRQFSQGFFRDVRDGQNLDWMAFVPLCGALLVYLDHNFGWLAGNSRSMMFLVCMVAIYAGIWLVSPMDEYPWRGVPLPTFFLLLVGLWEVLAGHPTPLLISLAFAWTFGAHVLLRRYPLHMEQVYSGVIKLGLVRRSFWMILAGKFIAIAWAVAALAMLPILLFRMAIKYRALYAGVAIYAGVLLGNVRSISGETKGLLPWVLAMVLSIQVLQALLQRLADYGLKKLNK